MVQGLSPQKGEDAAGSCKLPPDWSSEESQGTFAFSVGLLRSLGSWGEIYLSQIRAPWDFWPEQMGTECRLLVFT